MGRYAIVHEGLVENVVIWDGGDDWAPPPGRAAIETDSAATGWAWDGEAFTPPTPAPEPVPHEVTNRQMRLALIAIGKFDDVNALAQQMPQEAQVEWEYANHVYRDAPLIAGAGQMLGMTLEDVDDLFRLAATL